MTKTTKMTEEQKRLVEDNVNLANFLAMKVWQRNPAKLDKDELTSVAFQGLVTAAIRFDPETFERSEESVTDGSAFSSFARRRINGAILDWQRTQDHVPRQQRKIFKELQELGYGAGQSVETLSVLSGVPEKQIRTLASLVEQRTLSIDSEVRPQDSPDSGYVQFAQTLDSGDSTESSAVVSEVTGALVKAWESLPALEQQVIALRYYAGQELSAISELLETTPATVRYAHNEALDILYAAMKDQVS